MRLYREDWIYPGKKYVSGMTHREDRITQRRYIIMKSRSLLQVLTNKEDEFIRERKYLIGM